MTAHKDLKRRIRQRQSKTGESYTASRAQILRDRAALPCADDARSRGSERRSVYAAVIKVNSQSARVQPLGSRNELTFRSRDTAQLVPGQIVTLHLERRWTWRGSEHASGRIEKPRLDVSALGLEPLRLYGGEPRDLAGASEPSDMSAPLDSREHQRTARARPEFEFDGIAWGAFADSEPDEDPTSEAAELADAGDRGAARALLMDTLARDLRCLDAHAHLGNLEFDHWPERAMQHYEAGLRIGELSLPPGFAGVLPWDAIYNRPLLRCLHGYALCLWRLGRLHEAEQAFERMLSLNPEDHQGARSCLSEVREGRSWDELESGE